MGQRWAWGTVWLALSLACGGGAPTKAPAPEPISPSSASSSDVERLPGRVRALLPARSPTSVEPFPLLRRGETYRLRYAGGVGVLRDEMVAACGARRSCVVADHEGAWFFFVVAGDDGASVVKAVAVEDGGGVELTLTTEASAAGVSWPDQARCGPDRIPGSYTEEDGAVERSCYLQRGRDLSWDGPWTWVGDGYSLSGNHLAGKRDGVWTLRGPEGDVRSEGRFTAGEPEGTWVFEGEPVVFEEGEPVGPVPWVELLGDPALREGAVRWTFEVLDADLTRGVVSARWVYEVEPDDRGAARACAYPGLARPTDGVKLLLLQAGVREALGAWTVYASVLEHEACTSESAAREALDAAKAALAAHGLDSGERTALVPLVDGKLEVGARVVEVVEISEGLPDAQAMRFPDLVEGGFMPRSAGPRVKGYRVTIDGVEVQQTWMRVDPGCVGRMESAVAGAIVQGDRVALVWTGAHANCNGSRPFALVGPVW